MSEQAIFPVNRLILGDNLEILKTLESESEINFYSWDFDFDETKGFKASMMVDDEGKQTHHFKAGEYGIAVKAVDNDGLESVATFKIKVNGIVKKFSNVIK
jgi:hypothetical protein